MHFAIDRGRCGHDTCVWIDRKQSILITGQAISDRVGRRIQVERIRGNANGGSDRNVLVDLIRGSIGISRSRDAELVQIVDGDGKRSCRSRSIARRSLNRDRTRTSMHFAIDRGSGSHDTRVWIDCKQSILIAGQAVCDRVGGRIQVERIRGNAYRGPDRNVFIDLIRGSIGVSRRANAELVQIVDGDVNVRAEVDPSLEAA